MDGLPELLVSHGGDAKIDRYDPNRPAGQLIVVDSKYGKPLHRFLAPDRREIYMSPLCIDLADGQGLSVIFGTGGENDPGQSL